MRCLALLLLLAGCGSAGSTPVAEGKSEAQLTVAPNAKPELRLKRRGNGHFYVHGMVNGQIVEFLVDTGADGVALTVDDARRIGLPVEPASFQVIGTGASGAVSGQNVVLDRVEVEGRTLTGLQASVASGLQVSLLGQAFLRHLAVTMSGDVMVLK